MAELKGTGFASATAALREVAGEISFARMVATLPPATQALVYKPPLPMTWVEAIRFAELLQAAGRELLGGDERRAQAAARLAMGNDLRGVYKIFIRLLSPTYVISRGAKMWETYARNNGTMRSVPIGERGAEVHYDGIAPELSFPMYWAWQRGVLQAVGEATGIKNVRVETVSGGGHLGQCVLRATW
jgi:hypothetical protein